MLVVVNNPSKENKEKENFTLRYYGIGAQIIKDWGKNMILVTRTRKNYRFRRFWIKNKEARDYQMKKLLIVVSRYNNTNFY